MTETTETKRPSDQKYRKTESEVFDKYDHARIAYDALAKKLKCRKPGSTHDELGSANRVRIKLRSSGKFELVVFELISKVKEDNAKTA